MPHKRFRNAAVLIVVVIVLFSAAIFSSVEYKQNTGQLVGLAAGITASPAAAGAQQSIALSSLSSVSIESGYGNVYKAGTNYYIEVNTDDIYEIRWTGSLRKSEMTSINIGAAGVNTRDPIGKYTHTYGWAPAKEGDSMPNTNLKPGQKAEPPPSVETPSSEQIQINDITPVQGTANKYQVSFQGKTYTIVFDIFGGIVSIDGKACPGEEECALISEAIPSALKSSIGDDVVHELVAIGVGGHGVIASPFRKTPEGKNVLDVNDRGVIYCPGGITTNGQACTGATYLCSDPGITSDPSCSVCNNPPTCTETRPCDPKVCVAKGEEVCISNNNCIDPDETLDVAFERCQNDLKQDGCAGVKLIQDQRRQRIDMHFRSRVEGIFDTLFADWTDNWFSKLEAQIYAGICEFDYYKTPERDTNIFGGLGVGVPDWQVNYDAYFPEGTIIVELGGAREEVWTDSYYRYDYYIKILGPAGNYITYLWNSCKNTKSYRLSRSAEVEGWRSEGAVAGSKTTHMDYFAGDETAFDCEEAVECRFDYACVQLIDSVEYDKPICAKLHGADFVIDVDTDKTSCEQQASGRIYSVAGDYFQGEAAEE